MRALQSPVNRTGALAPRSTWHTTADRLKIFDGEPSSRPSARNAAHNQRSTATIPASRLPGQRDRAP